MVETTFVEAVVRTPDHVVPLQDVRRQGLGHDVGDRILERFRLVLLIIISNILLTTFFNLI